MIRWRGCQMEVVGGTYLTVEIETSVLRAKVTCLELRRKSRANQTIRRMGMVVGEGSHRHCLSCSSGSVCCQG